MSSDVVLKVENVSKCFEMYEKPVHRLFQTLCAGHKKFYKEFWALKDINFEVKRGECVGILGRNGAGKSTLLQIITGTLQPTSGKVETHGRIAALLELGSGFNPEFSGRDNVYMNAAVLGLSKAETDAKYQSIVEFADIGDFINQPVKTYSSGMMVRLAFAVQIMVEPDILIIDEALAVGDMFFQQKCYHYLKKLREKGTTLMFVSHSIAAVRSLCEKGVLLQEGSLIMHGDSGEVCDAYWNESVNATPKKTPDAQEKKQLNFQEDPDLAKRISDRIGTKALEFSAVGVYNSNGEPCQVFEYGDEVVVSASIRVNEDTPAGTAYAIACHTATAPQIFLVASDNYDLPLPEMKAGEKYLIETRFKCPLYEGNFFFNFSLKPDQSQEIYYDHIFNATVLQAMLPRSLQGRGYWGITHPENISITLNKRD